MNLEGGKYGVKDSIWKDFQSVLLKRKLKITRESRLKRIKYPFKRAFTAKQVIFGEINLTNHRFYIRVHKNASELSYSFELAVQNEVVSAEFQDLDASNITMESINGDVVVTITKDGTSIKIIMDSNADVELREALGTFVPGMQEYSEISSSGSDSEEAVVPINPLGKKSGK